MHIKSSLHSTVGQCWLCHAWLTFPLGIISLIINTISIHIHVTLVIVLRNTAFVRSRIGSVMYIVSAIESSKAYFAIIY